MNEWCRCGHHRDTHSGGSEVLGTCWAYDCPCKGDPTDYEERRDALLEWARALDEAAWKSCR